MTYDMATMFLALGIFFSLILVCIILFSFLNELDFSKLKYLFILIIPFSMIIIGGIFLNDPKLKYEMLQKNEREAKAEISKFLILHPEFKEEENARILLSE